MKGLRIIWGIILAVALVASGFVQSRLNVSRESLGLTRTAVISNAPPILAFTTVALGGFRGLIANALWIRTTELQEDGKYFEAVQLADWITKLQPHMTQVWVNQAWNMAYNISVKFPEPEERWRWVQRGIELIRDEGLRYNPNQVLMYRELGWLFQHKMGANLDDAHWLYKTRWAAMMEEVIPGGRLNGVELRQPSTPASVERLRRLRQQYKLEPEWMLGVDERYGPLDWRLPEAHVIYWATLGIKYSPAQDQVPLRREIFQPMLATFHHGRVITNRFAKRIELAPNLNVVTNVSRAYEEAIAAEPDNADHFGRAHRNFLKDAVYFLYANNREKEARQWFTYIRTKYGIGPQSGIPADATMEDFALSKVTEDVNETSRDRVMALLQGFITQSFYYLALDDDDQSVGLDRMALRIHANYRERTSLPGTVTRVALPEMSEIKRTVLLDILAPAADFNPEFQQVLRTKLGLAADFGIPKTNTPSATPPR
jgi:hypothetical protein